MGTPATGTVRICRQRDPHDVGGGTVDHGRIAGDLYFHLRARIAPKGCEAVFEGVKVIAAEQVHYPDIQVTCSAQDGRGDTVVDPVLIVDVPSPSTAAYDASGKWRNYQTIPTLQAYAMVEQDRPSVSSYVRDDSGGRTYRTITGLEAVLDLPPLSLSIPLAEVYRGVTLGGKKQTSCGIRRLAVSRAR